jgi:hypothetical protein
MIKTKIRCSKVVTFDKNLKPLTTVYLVIPSDTGQGYDLISCLKCGTIYCIDQISETYNPGIIEKSKCITCDSNLAESSYPYPDKFLTEDKKVCDFYNPYLVTTPPESDHIFEEFYDLHRTSQSINKTK